MREKSFFFYVNYMILSIYFAIFTWFLNLLLYYFVFCLLACNMGDLGVPFDAARPIKKGKNEEKQKSVRKVWYVIF